MCYHLILVLSVLATVLLGSLAKPFSPRWDDIRIMHSWNAVPGNWENLGNPPDGTTIDLYVALKAHRKNALVDTLYQVAELVSPPPGTLELVNSWLEYLRGVFLVRLDDTRRHHADSQWGVLLSKPTLSLAHHISSTGMSRQMRLSSARLVQTVVPTTWQSPGKRSGRVTAELKKPVSGENVTLLSSRIDDLTTPSFLRSLYKTMEYKPAALDRNALGIVGILNDYPSPDDLATFMSEFRSDWTNVAFTVVRVNGGGYDPTNPAAEANLDTQYAVAMAYPTPVIFYSIGRGTTDWLASWLGYILTESNIPWTVSISYVVSERNIPEAYAAYMCTQFAILGALGVSVLIATGDYGVGKGDCMTNDGSVRFIPLFPATCPYVTGRRWDEGSRTRVRGKPLRGGFLEHLSMPRLPRTGRDKIPAAPWATSMKGNTSAFPSVSATSRGIPDISAQALRFPIIVKGQRKVVSGTSGSAPLVASIVSLLNDYLVSRGKVTLGFLNPWLYGTGMSGLH
ncbi:subtilisin-like protein [Lactarius vividus]|nr:subtilisin-like protein [Lactarius vividus]